MTACHMCTYLYLTPETHAGALHTSLPPIIPPRSFLSPSGDIKQVRGILKFTKCNMTGQLQHMPV